MKKTTTIALAALVALSLFGVTACGKKDSATSDAEKAKAVPEAEEAGEDATEDEVTGEAVAMTEDTEDTDEAALEGMPGTDVAQSDVTEKDSAKTANQQSVKEADTAKTTTKKNDAKATTPAKQTNAATKANVHEHTWNPVYATRVIKEARTEEVTEEYTEEEMHRIYNGHHWQDGIGYDLTYQYNDYIANGHWKNEQPDAFWTDTKSWNFFVDCAQWVPDYIGDFSTWVKGAGSDYDQAGMPFATHDEAARFMRGSYHSEGVPVTKTRTYTLEHPAETETYVDHYKCSCGAINRP